MPMVLSARYRPEKRLSPHARFERLVLPHLDAGYNLARWLARDANDAQDVVQDACMRALKYMVTLTEGDARPWFLTIVRGIMLKGAGLATLWQETLILIGMTMLLLAKGSRGLAIRLG